METIEITYDRTADPDQARLVDNAFAELVGFCGHLAGTLGVPTPEDYGVYTSIGVRLAGDLMVTFDEGTVEEYNVRIPADELSELDVMAIDMALSALSLAIDKDGIMYSFLEARSGVLNGETDSYGVTLTEPNVISLRASVLA